MSTAFILLSGLCFLAAGVLYQLGYDPHNAIEASKIYALLAIAASIQERHKKP